MGIISVMLILVTYVGKIYAGFLIGIISAMLILVTYVGKIYAGFLIGIISAMLLPNKGKNLPIANL